MPILFKASTMSFRSLVHACVPNTITCTSAYQPNPPQLGKAAVTAGILSDDEWCNFLAGTGMPRHTPPPLPPEKFQTAL
jgi:hypothetical protein